MSDRVLTWLIPSGIVGMMSVAFAVGLYVGRMEMREYVLMIEQRLQAHVEVPRHRDAVSADVLNLRFGDITRRLERIEARLERWEENQ